MFILSRIVKPVNLGGGSFPKAINLMFYVINGATAVAEPVRLRM